MWKTIKYVQLTVLFFITPLALSQELYVAEVGFHGGTSYFLGDVESAFYDVQPDFGVQFQYLIDKRMSIQADYHHTFIYGDYKMRVDSIGDPYVNLSQHINALDLVFAFNFLDYGKLEYLLNSSNHSFYLYAGLGLMHLHKNNSVHLSFPIGIGYKVKLTERMHFNAQWTHRLMFADNIEGDVRLDDPLQLNGTNFFNNDHLGSISVGISVSLLRRKCQCQNYY